MSTSGTMFQIKDCGKHWKGNCFDPMIKNQVIIWGKKQPNFMNTFKDWNCCIELNYSKKKFLDVTFYEMNVLNKISPPACKKLKDKRFLNKDCEQFIVWKLKQWWLSDKPSGWSKMCMYIHIWWKPEDKIRRTFDCPGGYKREIFTASSSKVCSSLAYQRRQLFLKKHIVIVFYDNY